MNLLVLGPTGGTGRAVVDQALSRGHRVTAFARSPDKLDARDGLTRIAGDPRRADQLRAALPGHDAVVSALGQRTSSDLTLLTDCARAIVATSAPRLIVVSSALLFPDIGWFGRVLGRFVFAAALRDSREMEAIVAASATIWTIARPPRLTNGEHTGTYRVARDALPPGGRSISRADLAHALLDEAERGAHPRAILGVSR